MDIMRKRTQEMDFKIQFIIAILMDIMRKRTQEMDFKIQFIKN